MKGAKKRKLFYSEVYVTRSACFTVLWITLMHIILLLPLICLFKYLFMGTVLLSG